MYKFDYLQVKEIGYQNFITNEGKFTFLAFAIEEERIKKIQNLKLILGKSNPNLLPANIIRDLFDLLKFGYYVF